MVNLALLTVLTTVGAIISPKSSLGDAHSIPTRYDYRQTFKHPFLVSNYHIPYFNHSGDALMTKEFLRLVPSLPFKSGAVWCETANPHKEWMVEFSFSIYGRAMEGGDGFVFWYTKEQRPKDLPMDFYGQRSNFEGVGIVFDTADPKLNRHNPFIYAVKNDGTKSADDFKNYMSSTVSIASCFREYRNTPTPVFVKIIYSQQTLSVEVDIRQKGQAYTNCLNIPILLPTNYHFGLSATTGLDGGRDDHDFYSFEVYELNPPPKAEKIKRPHEEEDIKSGHEFKMNEELEKRIHQAEGVVESVEAEAAEELSQDSETLRSLNENQFHILEALNSIQDKLDIKPTGPVLTKDHQDELESRLRQDISHLRNEMQSLKEELAVLQNTASALKANTDALLGLTSQNQHLISQSNSSTSQIGTSLQYLAGVGAVGVLLFAYTYMRGGNGASKKFV